MNSRILRWPLVALILSACHAAPPTLSLTTIPAEPLVEKLEQRSRSFSGLKAAARVETEHQGRKRSYESVAVLLQGAGKLRVEGYDPLGTPQFAVLWSGGDILFRRGAEGTFRQMSREDLVRLLGVTLLPGDLCSLLSGNVPSAPRDSAPTAGCRTEGHCVVEFRKNGLLWRVFVSRPDDQPEGLAIEAAEVYDGGSLVFRSTFLAQERINGYLFPRRVVIEQPARAVRLTVEYEDLEVNVPVDDSLFLPEGGDR
ncbi:MAG: hypothetical protein M0042_13245 [Nitrospiraceae bacterium]|nr:hypothetical protein [Nitrospiraceae bacterium]